jgi:hypothetical protein
MMPVDRGANEMEFVSEGFLIRHSIQNGDRLELRSGDQRVLVRDVSVLGDDKYAGSIYAIEPSGAANVNGLTVGQTVVFNELNVFGVVA